MVQKEKDGYQRSHDGNGKVIEIFRRGDQLLRPKGEAGDVANHCHRTSAVGSKDNHGAINLPQFIRLQQRMHDGQEQHDRGEIVQIGGEHKGE